MYLEIKRERNRRERLVRYCMQMRPCDVFLASFFFLGGNHSHYFICTQSEKEVSSYHKIDNIDKNLRTLLLSHAVDR